MYKIYFKQAIAVLKQNPLLGIISIVGTALAICMIMVIVIVYEIRNADYRPETNRSRMLYVTSGVVTIADKNVQSSSPLSLRTIKGCYRDLKTPEAVAIAARYQPKLAMVPGGAEKFNSDILYTDENFWKVFDFSFLSGKPYTDADVQSGIKKAVISETVARKLYGTTDVAGKEMFLSYESFMITGVVRDVSILAESAYSQIWVPYSTDQMMFQSWEDDLLGFFNVYILAHSSADFPEIQSEVEQRVKQFNTTIAEYQYDLQGHPDTQFTFQARVDENTPDLKSIILRYTVIILILLLVPAINLSGMTISRLRKRMTEIGVSKAFGATKGDIVWQVLSENMVVSLMGGLIGLIFSYIALFLLRDWMFGYAQGMWISGLASVNTEMLFNPMVFLYAFLFCLVLNLLSAGLPAWRVASGKIVDALKAN